MAVKKIHAIDKYIGLSTDTKPTKVKAGSIYIEVNTGTNAVKKYVTPDGTNWYETTLPLEE